MDVYSGLAVILGLAALGGILARAAKLPVIIGYVAAGVVVAGIGSLEIWLMRLMTEVMGKLGVTLLLFLAGMELPLSELKKTGKTAMITGITQIFASAGMGYLLARILGFSGSNAIYLGIGLAFGSTILVVKILSEKGDIQSLSGKMAVGVLLVQDFVAIGMLAILSGFSGGALSISGILWVVVKVFLLIAAALWFSEKIMKPLLGYLSRSTELLFICSIGWCLTVAALISLPAVGLSAEIGGFLAGLALAGAVEQGQIISRVRPLRDFFLTWFFVALGTNINLGGIGNLIFPATVFTIFVLIINPILIMAVLGGMGYKKRNRFMVGIALTQISEFSLIVASLGVKNGQADRDVLSILTVVAVISMTISTYILWNKEILYRKWGRKIAGMFGKEKGNEKEIEKLKNHIVLFGHNRIGSVLRPVLDKLGPTLVVDFNPVVVDDLTGKGVSVLYGDMSDHELYERINLQEAVMVVSTVPDIRDSVQLLSELSGWEKRPVVVLTGSDDADAKRLYQLGADYVLVPHSVGGEWLKHVFEHQGVSKETINKYGQEHLARLREL